MVFRTMAWRNLFLAAICMLSMLLLIYFRANIENFFAQQFHTHKEFSSDKYPTDFNSISLLWQQGYKWAFTVSFTILFSLLSLGCVWFLFPYKNVLNGILFIFAIVIVLIFFFSIISLATHSYQLGFGVVLYLKKLLHTPYLTLFIILYYWKINNPKPA